MPDDFHEVRFPLAVALGASGGPRRRTDIVTLGSGREQRNTRWAMSRRFFDAGYGVKSLDALAEIVAFFEERRGRLYGFRWRDRLDFKSCPPSLVPAPTDQLIGTGDGETLTFQLAKTYGAAHAPYRRIIAKPVAGSVRVALDGIEQAQGLDFTADEATGLVTFTEPPGEGVAISAGFLFDVPVRFDTDELDIDLSAFEAGIIPKIPVIEIII